MSEFTSRIIWENLSYDDIVSLFYRSSEELHKQTKKINDELVSTAEKELYLNLMELINNKEASTLKEAYYMLYDDSPEELICDIEIVVDYNLYKDFPCDNKENCWNVKNRFNPSDFYRVLFTNNNICSDCLTDMQYIIPEHLTKINFVDVYKKYKHTMKEN
jgi:hypothetical protein